MAKNAKSEWLYFFLILILFIRGKIYIRSLKIAGFSPLLLCFSIFLFFKLGQKERGTKNVERKSISFHWFCQRVSFLVPLLKKGPSRCPIFQMIKEGLDWSNVPGMSLASMDVWDVFWLVCSFSSCTWGWAATVEGVDMALGVTLNLSLPTTLG